MNLKALKVAFNNLAEGLKFNFHWVYHQSSPVVDRSVFISVSVNSVDDVGLWRKNKSQLAKWNPENDLADNFHFKFLHVVPLFRQTNSFFLVNFFKGFDI